MHWIDRLFYKDWMRFLKELLEILFEKSHPIQSQRVYYFKRSAHLLSLPSSSLIWMMRISFSSSDSCSFTGVSISDFCFALDAWPLLTFLPFGFLLLAGFLNFLRAGRKIYLRKNVTLFHRSQQQTLQISIDTLPFHKAEMERPFIIKFKVNISHL